MFLDTKAMRYLASEDWKVLTAVEVGSKSHELVPTSQIEKTSRLRGGANGVQKSISALAKVGLIARVKEAKYDGYRLTYGGLDYLALQHHSQKKVIYSVGTRVGVGKESDIMIVAGEKGDQRILKIHRLGRISFRSVKSNRDYLKNKQSGSWQYLSKLAAQKEFAFMQALQEEGFPVPEPMAHSRHTIVMSLIDSFPLRQIAKVADPAALYADLIAMILRLAKHGLIHGDFNEFNILIKETPIPGEDGQEETIKVEPILIDFPQMVSMDHENAEMYFDRDVACVKRFFSRKFGFTPDEAGPFFKEAKKTVGADGARRLDAAVMASGFTKKQLKDLEAAIREKEAKAEAKREAKANDPDYEDSEESGSDEGSSDDDEGALHGRYDAAEDDEAAASDTEASGKGGLPS